MAVKRKLQALVTIDVFTPYKLGEIFCVPEEDAEKLLRVDRTKNEYGVPRYPKIKVRRFNPDLDGDLLLASGTLNLDDHNRLLSKLHPDRPKVEVRMSQYESEVTNLLDEIDPDRIKDYNVEDKKVKVGVAVKADNDDDESESEPESAPRGRRGRPARQ